MFYSHDLLGRKSSLGIVWTIAHGKKLSKCKILSIDVSEVCTHIMNPEVPHSLRLQGILIGGLVILYSKQQLYLLEDLQEMLKRVKMMGMVIEPHVAPGSVMIDNKKRNKARLDAITMQEPSEMTALDSHWSQQNLPFLSLHLDDEQQMEQHDLFVVPTLAPTGEASRGNTTASLPLKLDDQFKAPPYNPADYFMMDGPETFEVNADGLMLDDLNMGLAPGEAPTELAAMMPDVDMKEFIVPEELPAGQDGFPEFAAELPAAGQEELVPPADAVDGKQDKKKPARARKAKDATAVAEESEASEELAAFPAAQPAAAAAARKRLNKPRRHHAPVVVDELEEVQIRGRVYREWTMDSSDLLVARPAKSVEVAAAVRAEAPSPIEELLPLCLGETQREVCVELQETFKTAAGGEVAPGPQAEKESRAAEKQRLQGGRAGTYPQLPLDPVPAPMEQYEQLDLQAPLMDEVMPYPDDAFAIDPMDHHNGVANVGLVMSFGEVERERLRAALHTPASEEDRQARAQFGVTPGSKELPQGALTTGKRSRATSGSSSSLHEESETELNEGPSPRRQRTALADDAGTGMDPTARFGTGNLCDLLPAVAEEGEEMEQQNSEHGSDAHGQSARQGGSITQFELLETFGSATQLAPKDSLNKNSMEVLRYFKSALGAMPSQAEPAPSLSFFKMVTKLSRAQAVKLFYQICVTSSLDFIQASQEKPYGDIIVRPGKYL